MSDIAIGFGAGLAVVAALAWRQHQRLSQRGALLAAQMQQGGNDLAVYLLVRGADTQDELEYVARKEAEILSRQTATAVLSQQYGLTPERISKMQALHGALTALTRW